jgi:predicted membrane-bound mannosyltransferase
LTRRGRGLVTIVVVVGVGLRFLRLDADPHYYDWIGYITDEGRWIDQARELVLFGSSDGRPSLHMLVGPLFQGLSYGVFRVLGVSILSSRLISAASGSLLLLAFWLGMRRVASAPILLLTMTMLTFTEDLVVLSRIATPEMAVMAAYLLIYLMIISERRRPLLLVLAGAAALITVGIKVTAMPVVGIFALLVLIQPRDPSWARSRWRDLALFLGGLLGPFAAVATLWAARGMRADSLLTRGAGLANAFVAPNSPYGAVGFVFNDSMAAVLNLWLLAFWCALVGWRAAGNLVDAASRRALVTSVTWVGLYAVLMLGLNYFPNRYKVHILVPMAVACAVGLSLLQRAGRARVDALGAEKTGVHAALVAGLLGLPSAIAVAPVLAGTVGFLGGDPARLLIKIASILFTVIVGGLALFLLGTRRPSSVFLVAFPVTAALIWSTVQRTGVYDIPFWPIADFAPHAIGWLVILSVSGLIAGVAATQRQLPGGMLVFASRVTALWYFALCLPALVPTFLTPHYSIRSASRQLATSLTDVAEPIGSSGADGLFREGPIHFRSVWGRTWPATRPSVMVIAFDFRDTDGILESQYCLVDVLPLYVSPMYFRTHPGREPTSELGESVRIYRQRSSDGCRH